ncbi:MAG: TonB-dependent receptor [Myxococcota bacterium]
MPRRFFQGRSVLALLLGILALLLVSDSVWAATGGQLRVVVSDEDELPIPGVNLELTGESLIGGLQEKASDGEGVALFVELPPGVYRLVASKAGFGGVTIEGIQVNLNRTTIQAVTLQAGAVEEIEVKAKAKAVDVESTSTSKVLTKDFLQRIPAGRTYQNAVQTVPGVTQGSGGNPGMAGGASNENTYMLDGANITDPVTGTFSLNFNFDAIEQIEVLLGGYMPEYGTSVGGVINVVTESGTNNLQMQTNIFYNNGNLAPKTDERLAADGLPIAPTGFDSQFQTLQIAQKLSGPLIRDKAWFVISYQSARSLIARSGIPQARDYDGHYILAKLTVQPNPEHRLSFFVQSDPTTVDNTDQSNPFVKAEAQGRQAQGGFVSNLRWQWFLAPEMNLDTAILFQKSFIEANAVPCTHDRTRDWHPCRPGEQEGYVDWETPGRVGINGAYDSVNYGFYYFDDRLRYNASTKLSLLSVEDRFGGTHDLKFGLEGNQIVWDQIQGYSGNTLYYDINEVSFDPLSLQNYYWVEITGPIKFRTTASEYNAFAQDSWKPVSNLTINYGTRFDAFVFRNDLGEPVLSGALLGPRLFGAWDPFGDQRTKIATGYGRFNDTGRLGVASFTSAANFGSKLYLGEYFGGADCMGFLNSQSNLYSSSPKDNLAIAHDHLRAPRVDELLLTLEREVVQDVALFTTLSGKFFRYLYEPDDRNLIWDSDGSTPIGSRFSDPDQYYLRLRSPELAKRDYFRWDLGVRKVESRRWAAEASYSYTQSVGSSTNSLSGSFANDPQTKFNYGPLNTDLRHTGRAYAYWDLPTDPWTIQLSALFIYTDGFPEERLYVSEGPQIYSYSLRVRPRGTYLRFNPNWTFNVGYTQNIDVRKGQIFVRLEALNLFNNRSPEFVYAGLIDTQNRLVTSQRQDPLQLQGAIGYKF